MEKTDSIKDKNVKTADTGEIFEKVKNILAASLELDQEEITPASSLNLDLGAESVDFLDISFRIDSEFNVELPNRELSEIAENINTIKMEAVKAVFQGNHDISLPAEEVKSLSALGIKAIFAAIEKSHGITCKDSEIEKAAADTIAQSIGHLRTFGFEIPQEKIEELKNDILEGVDPPTLMQKIMSMYSVQTLINYIHEKLGA